MGEIKKNKRKKKNSVSELKAGMEPFLSEITG